MNWEIFERVYSSHWFISSFNSLGWVRGFPLLGGGDFITKFIAVMENGTCKYIYDTEEFDASANFAANRLLNDRQWRLWMYKKINYYTKKYFAAGEKLRQLPFSDLSDKEMVDELDKILPLQKNHHIYSVLVNGPIIDGKNHLSNKIRQELQGAIGDSKEFDKYWSILTMPTKMSLRQKKDYAIAKLAKSTKKNNEPEILTELKKIHKKYCWLDYMYVGPAALFKKFKEELQEAVKDNINIDLPERMELLRKKQKKLINKLKLNRRSQFLVKLAQYVLWQKGYRKDVMYHGFYCYEPYFRELTRRKRVKNWRLVAFLFPWEIKGFILRNNPTVFKLKERKSYSCFIVDKEKTIFKTGRAARLFVKTLKLKENLSDIRMARGQCAYSGKAIGRVKIIHIPKDMSKMKKGDIIISQATSPDLLPAMKKAAAIVTNTGGLICHAAITSRELKIPCIVGTGNATFIFKDGDLVDVDANKGVVKILKRARK